MTTDIVNLRPGFSLSFRSPITQGQQPIFDFAVSAENFDVRLADDGSDYLNFKISTEQFDIRTMVNFFETGIAGDMRMVTDTNSVVWRGILRAMVLSAGGDAEIRDLRYLYNQAIVEYDGGDSGTLEDSVSSPESKLYFGTKLIRFTDTKDLSLADATRRGLEYLKLNAWARARAYSGDSRDTLSFQFTGYLWLLDWCEATLAQPITVQNAIEQIITNCGQGIITFTGTSIGDNGQTWTTDITGSGLDLIRKLTNTLDTSGNVWRFYIDPLNVAHWEPVDFNPQYARRVGTSPSTNGVFIGLTGSQRLKTWTGQAGVVIRNTAYPIEAREVGSPFLSRQDRYIKALRYNKDGEPIFESLTKYNEAWSQGEEYDIQPTDLVFGARSGRSLDKIIFPT